MPGDDISMSESPGSGNSPDTKRPTTPKGTKPPPEHQRRIYETPAMPRSAHSSGLRDGNLPQKRLTLLREIGYAVPQEKLDTFLQYFLPPLQRGISVDSLMTSLTHDGTITKNRRWESFPKNPVAYKNENTVFYALENVFNKVVQHACRLDQRLSPTFVLRLLPDKVPKSERGSTTKPDGCFVLRDSLDHDQDRGTEDYSWYNIGLTCEFKLHDTDTSRDDDVTKIVFSMQHTMSLDPCRRFTFGITIENTSVRLWFSSRAVMVVSEKFNFIEQPEILTHVFLAIAFASKEELGWDPTIRVVDPAAEKRVYEIEVKNKWYEVLDVLSDFGADAIVGRATRVFKVRCLDSDPNVNKCYVLKDVWVEDDRELEHDIYRRILDDVKGQFSEAEMGFVASHLLTPLDHWLVPVGHEEDHTTMVMTRGHTPSFKSTFKLTSEPPSNEDASKSTAPMRSTDRDVHDELNTHIASRLERPVFRDRRHYRIVFEEIAQPIWTLTDLSDAFLVLRDCAKGIYIHESGWVHRDISAGNVYFFDKRGLIGDLEYAKKMVTDGKHQMRTGTPDFMAIEVMNNQYLFLPAQRSADATMRRLEEIMSRSKTAVQEEPSHHAFVQNPAHDIESLWWISIYLLFFNGDVKLEGKETPEQLHARQVHMNRVFPSDITPIRESFLRVPGEYDSDTKWLPESFKELSRILDLLRDTLVDCYYGYEKSFKFEVFLRLHDLTEKILSSCVEKAAGIKVASYKVLGRKKQKALSQPIEEPDESVPGPVGKRRRRIKDIPKQRPKHGYFLRRRA